MPDSNFIFRFVGVERSAADMNRNGSAGTDQQPRPGVRMAEQDPATFALGKLKDRFRDLHHILIGKRVRPTVIEQLRHATNRKH